MALKKFIFIILFFKFINSQIESITLKTEDISFKSLTKPIKYKIIPESQPFFIQIIVKKNINPSITNNTNNFFISYYQKDEKFETRNQFSKSFQGKAIMWLNKEQIKYPFYLEIECENTTYCDYSFKILHKKVQTLSFNEKYSYYVTEENKQNKFSININPPKTIKKHDLNLVEIWAKGDKNVTTSLIGDKYEKFLKYNAYIVYIESNEHYKLIFNVNGEIGDLITIGVVFFENGISNMYANINFEGLIEIDNLLKKEIAEKLCYKIPFTEEIKFENLNYLLKKDIDTFSHSIYPDMLCADIVPYVDEDFYSIQYIVKNRKKINYYNPLSYGAQYNAYIYENESMAIIPLGEEDDINHLSYYIFTLGFKKEIYLYDCDTYPSCQFNKNNSEKLSPLEGYYSSYSYTYKKSELKNKLNPISKKQKVLVLTCLKGMERFNNFYCIFLINIYTDKSKIEFGQIFNQYRFAKEGNEDHYIINKNLFKSSDEEHGFLNIETISGDISVFTKEGKNKLYQKDNKKLLIINKNIVEFPFTIVANKNSLYYLNYYGVGDNELGTVQFYGMHNGNYLFNLNKNESLHLQIYTLPSEEDVTQKYPIFTAFYPLGCKIDGVRNYYENFTDCYNEYLEAIPKKYDFYQFIYKGSEFEFGEFNQDGFNVNKTENEPDICLFYSSFFILGNEKYEGGIGLAENIPRRVLFNKKYNELNFTYPIIDLKKGINIQINLLNEGKYKIILFLENIKLEKEYEISSNINIPLKNKLWKDICKDNNQICKIYLDIISENNENEKFLEIIVNTKDIEEQKDKIDSIN